MKRIQMPIAPSSSSTAAMPVYPKATPMMQDLLWISKQQQQHPSTHAHPLKNTIRLSSNGIRHKFDGKQWRPLCESSDGYECRNLAFRSALCQKHFYKLHLFKRPYIKNGSIPPPAGSSTETHPFSLKRPLSNTYEHHDEEEEEEEDMYNDDDENSIQVLENNDPMIHKRDNQPKFTFFSIDCDSQAIADTSEANLIKPEPLPKAKRLDPINNDSLILNQSQSPSLNVSIPKVTESIRLGLPPLTRTEEKSLANELITQLPTDASLTIGEQMARRRACEIVMDNYSQQFSSINITSEWFYDFLLRHPRVPIHFQSWFASIKSTIPLSDQLIDIKMWELGLITRSIVASSSISTSSSSP